MMRGLGGASGNTMALQRGEGAPSCDCPLDEMELRLANIMALMRDIAARAEERLRDVSAPQPVQSFDGGAAVMCAPPVIEASRVQINALRTLFTRDQPLAA